MDLTLEWNPSPDAGEVERCLVEYCQGGVRYEVDAADVADVVFEGCDPVRSFPGWRGKRHYDGHQWMGSFRKSIGFESLTERACLIELDRVPSVAAVASQPMWIRWPEEKDPPREHVPDYFVRLEDGQAVLVDVKRAGGVDARAKAQFDRTALICRELGWRYVVYEGASRTRDANLRFLSRFRESMGDRTVPTLPPSGAPLGFVAELLGGGAEGLSRCYAQLWRGHLQMDFEAPLSLRSTLHEGEA